MLWLNPYRFSNQVYSLVLLILTTWLGCVYRAMQIGATNIPNKILELEWWFRANAIAIAFLPASMWLLQGSIVHSHLPRQQILYRTLPVIALSLVSAALCLTPSFITSDSSGVLHRGISYYAYGAIGLGVYAACVIVTLVQMHSHSGIRRVELQFLALNAGGSALLLLGLNVFGNMLQIRAFNRLSVFLVFGTSTVTACALLLHRIFNAKEVFLRLTYRLWFSLILSAGIYSIWRLTSPLIAEPFNLLFSVAVFSPIAVWLDKQSRAWIDFGGELKLSKLRREAISISHTEAAKADLIARLKQLLFSAFQSTSVTFLTDKGLHYGEDCIALAKSRQGCECLCELGWITPESLERRKPTKGLQDLGGFVQDNAIGVIVTAPRGSSSPTMMVALGVRPDGQPYTFPEIERLQNLSELIDSMLIRTELTTQAALRARLEYLSLVSRGLAHDLRNLITPVSTFLLHTNNLFADNNNVAEVHREARRSMGIISDYVEQTLSFSKRQQPQLDTLCVVDVCARAMKLTVPRAERKGVVLVSDVAPSLQLTADGVLIERMLVNVLSNAIDASKREQIVSIHVSIFNKQWMLFRVEDSGRGMSPAELSLVFDPYFTTKSVDAEAKGFGLGLTIAHNIVLLHHGHIHVQSEKGKQTHVSMLLPLHHSKS
jgi:signal transduction histidine kinase